MAEKHIIAGSVIEDSAPLAVESAGLGAARDGRAFCRKVNAKTGIHGAATVLTDAGLLQPTAAGYRDVIKCVYAHLNTGEDAIQFEIVVTANADGTGDVTVLTPMIRHETGVTIIQSDSSLLYLDPPIVITPAMGGAWTIRAQTNDVGASVTFGLNGWREPIPA